MSDIEYVVVMHDGSRSTKFMSEAYCKDLMEQLAAAQSQEVCTVAHDNVETCGYCQRDALAARLAEAIECCTIKDNRNLWLEIRLKKIMARCADLLDEDQFNELDAVARATDPTDGAL